MIFGIDLRCREVQRRALQWHNHRLSDSKTLTYREIEVVEHGEWLWGGVQGNPGKLPGLCGLGDPKYPGAIGQFSPNLALRLLRLSSHRHIFVHGVSNFNLLRNLMYTLFGSVHTVISKSGFWILILVHGRQYLSITLGVCTDCPSLNSDLVVVHL